jgi:phosphate transport system permease protein
VTAIEQMVPSTSPLQPHQVLGTTRRRYGEMLVKAALLACAALSIAVTTAILVSLVVPTIGFFREIPLGEFLTGTVWAPAYANPSFGVLPIVVGTLMVVVFSMAVAVPIGLASAVFLSEYAPARVRAVIKPALEVLQGIPTVATGLFAFFLLRPLAEDLLPFLGWKGPFSIGVAGVAVGFMIVPLVSSIADDAMRSVPAGLREGAYALGSSKISVTLRVVFPAAISGIAAAIILGASRAVGETMIVLIAAGAGNPNLSFNPAEGIQTMTAYIAGRATGDIAQGTIVYDTIFAVGSLLFVITLTMNLVSTRLVRRFREIYE